MKLAYYINHFFAGIGGEDKADTTVGVREGPVGPGNGLKNLLSPGITIAGTVYAGDNYFNENVEKATKEVLDAVRAFSPDALIAGPAFDAGRYGVACAEVCNTVSRELGIPSVSAMYEENPGVDVYRNYRNPRVFFLPSGPLADTMSRALADMAGFVDKIALGAEPGSAASEGYFHRGIRRLVEVEKSGAERAVAMLLARLNDQPFSSEVPLRGLDPITPAAPLANLAGATIALANTTGIVPIGNPDAFKRMRNTQWKKYFIGDLESVEQGEWEAVHGGHDTRYTNSNPNWGVPLDAARVLEREEVFAHLHPYLYTTPGVQASVNLMQQFGREMAQEMLAAGVNGVIMVST
ncbi:MAG: glycine/betaine/sarcosine/D-proline family reductase selenoprotein B [Chloroflexi bacterium]|nr:glycine/betaine/sarcosine/D-proline family reductase selenoprotein B [Chloroflexota bacterium]